MEKLKETYLDIYSNVGTHIVDESFDQKILEIDFKLKYHKSLFIYLKKIEKYGYMVNEYDLEEQSKINMDEKIVRSPVNFKNFILNLKPIHYKHLFVTSFIKNFAIIKQKIELSFSNDWYPKNVNILPINLIISKSEYEWVDQIKFYCIEKHFINLFNDQYMSLPLLSEKSIYFNKLNHLKEIYSKKGNIKCHFCNHSIKNCSKWCVNRVFVIILLNYNDLNKFKKMNEWLFNKNSNLIVQRVFFDDIESTISDNLFNYETRENLINSFKIYYLPKNGDMKNIETLLDSIEFIHRNETEIPLAIRKKWIIHLDENFVKQTNLAISKKNLSKKSNSKRKCDSPLLEQRDESIFNLFQYIKQKDVKQKEKLNSFYLLF